MLSMQALCEAPLCSPEYCHYSYVFTTLQAEHSNLIGKILSNTVTTTLTLSQTPVLAQGLTVTNVITVDDDLNIVGIYNANVSHIVTLQSEDDSNVVYVVAVEHPVYLADNLVVNNIYNLEVCDGILVGHKIGWVIELEASNTIGLSFEELDAAFNEFVIEQLVETNMDDLTCLAPYGKNLDKSASNSINIAQSVDGKMVYVCSVNTDLTLISSVAWR